MSHFILVKEECDYIGGGIDTVTDIFGVGWGFR
jgi:hypothetical protein